MTSSQTSCASELVGRDAQIALLDRRLAEAQRGRGGLVFLAGEPGIGKSRLAEEVDSRAHRLGFGVVWGRCRETEGAPAFWPWTQILRAGLAGSDAAVPEDLRPLLDSAFSAPRQTDRFQLFDAVAGFLLGLSRAHPLVLVLDDLHRADHPSLLLLDFLAPAARDASLLVVGTFRDTEVGASHPLRGIVGNRTGDAGVDHLTLGGLSLADTARLAAGRRSEGARLSVAELQRRSDGNPFFVIELLRLPADVDPSVPATVSAAITERVRRLPRVTQRLLTLAAVLGSDLRPALLGVLDGSDADRVDARLAPAVTGGLLRPTGSPEPAYRFVHALVRDALYAAIPVSGRAALHDRVLSALMAGPGDGPTGASDLASHAVRAVRSPEERRRAARLAADAGVEARDRLAHEDAAAWFGRALEVGTHGAERRFALLMQVGECAGRASQVGTAREAYEQAWALAWDAGWRRRLAEVALGLGEVIDSAGSVDAGLVRMLELALERADPADRLARIRLAARLAVGIYWGPRLPEARRLAAEAVAAARRLGDARALAVALGAQQFALRGPGRLAERLRLGQELVGHARGSRDEPLEIQARRFLLADRWQVDPAAVDADLRALDLLAQQTRRPRARWYVMVNECIRASLAGRPEPALELVDRTAAFGRRIGASPAAMYGVAQRFFLLRECGRGAQAEDELRAVIAEYPRLATFRCALVLLLAEAGRCVEAEALLSELVAEECRAIPPDALWSAGLAQLTIAAARLGRRQEAAVLHRLLAPHSGEIVQQGVVAWWGAVDHYLGLAAMTLGRWEEADRLLVSALGRHEAWGAVPHVRAGLEALAAVRRRGGPPPAAGPAGPRVAELTVREREVLRLLATGEANKQIARRLAISVHTVERHVTNAYTKIGAHNRVEAAAYLRAQEE